MVKRQDRRPQRHPHTTTPQTPPYTYPDAFTSAYCDVGIPAEPRIQCTRVRGGKPANAWYPPTAQRTVSSPWTTEAAGTGQ